MFILNTLTRKQRQDKAAGKAVTTPGQPGHGAGDLAMVVNVKTRTSRGFMERIRSAHIQDQHDPEPNPYVSLAKSVIEQAIWDAIYGHYGRNVKVNRGPKVRETNELVERTRYAALRFLGKPNKDLVFWCRVSGIDPHKVLEYFRPRLIAYEDDKPIWCQIERNSPMPWEPDVMLVAMGILPRSKLALMRAERASRRVVTALDVSAN